MSLFLKQSTAKTVSFGPFVDKGDGVTLETGLVSALDHASTGILLSKNGGALTIRHASVTASSYDAYGNYIVTLDATDTNTLGTLRMQFSEAATCLPVWQDFIVLAANVYDSLVGGGDVLDVSVTQWTGTNVAAPATAGYPVVTHKVGTGTGEINLSSGKVPATLAVGDDWKVVRTNTAQAGAASTITLDASASATDSLYRDLLIAILSGAGAGQVRLITGYVGSTKVATVEAAWTAAVDNTSVFALLHAGACPRVSGNVAGSVGGNVAGSVASVVGAVGSVTGAVGSVTGLTASDVGAIKSKTDNLPSDPADASDIASSFSTLTTKVDTIDDFLDTEVAAIKAKTDNLPSDPADASDVAAAVAAIQSDTNDIQATLAATLAPVFLVLADAIYTNGKLDVSACLIRNGQVDLSVSNARAKLYTLSGTLIDSLTTVALPDDQGEFRFPQLTRTLSANSMYYCVVTIEDATTGGTDRSANVKLKRFA